MDIDIILISSFKVVDVLIHHFHFQPTYHLNILGCNSSGPQDLLIFMSLIYSSIISLGVNRSWMKMSVLRANLGISPSGSLVKTLLNCF